MAKTAKEREDIMTMHAREGKFRKFATGGWRDAVFYPSLTVYVLCFYVIFVNVCVCFVGVYVPPGTMSIDEINVYRETLRKSNAKKPCKSGQGPGRHILSLMLEKKSPGQLTSAGEKSRR